jgi:hypothetical protein
MNFPVRSIAGFFPSPFFALSALFGFLFPPYLLQAGVEKAARPNIMLILAADVSADELAPCGGTIADRKRFEKYLQKIPLPDEKDPSTRQAWKRFRASPEGAPVKVFRPAYLD